jgi:hypothetical protein
MRRSSISESKPSENANEEARAEKLRRRGIHDGGAPLDSVKDLVKDGYLNDSGDVDWEKVGTRVGLDPEQIRLLVARAGGTATRDPDNQAAWKRLQRKYPVAIVILNGSSLLVRVRCA